MLKIEVMDDLRIERSCKADDMDRWTAYIPSETKRDIEQLKTDGYKIAKYLRSVIVQAVEDIKTGRVKESA